MMGTVSLTLVAQSVSAYQISLKSDDIRLRYSDKTIFKMAAVRHLEFSKFGILVIWPVLERDSALSYKCRVNRTIIRRDIAKRRFSIWRPSAILDLL